MTGASFVPTADPRGRDDLPRDTATRLYALLLSQRDDEARRLQQLATARDPAFMDEHAEISATVASETLNDIDYALSRFDAGTYGRCEGCGGTIPLERLEAIPHATTCVGCVVVDNHRDRPNGT
jgi:RNA polymerase-binding transcription factor DksA